ncbi:MAG: hypothetical protein H6Q23_1860 [Bacteroidetes bacterium]|nr:hypothetical protein [Bacteroidota bacterium]
MSPGFRFGVLLIFSLPGIYVAQGQTALSFQKKIDLTDLGRKIENTVCFNTSVKDFGVKGFTWSLNVLRIGR